MRTGGEPSRFSHLLCFVPAQILSQVRVVPYVLHADARGRIHRAEEVPQVGSVRWLGTYKNTQHPSPPLHFISSVDALVALSVLWNQ